MEVSTSFCTPAVNFKYGSYQDPDVSLRDDDVYQMGSYNSQGYYVDGTHLEGSIGDDYSLCSMDEEVECEGMDVESRSAVFDDDSVGLTEDMEEQLVVEDDEDNNDEWTNKKRHENQDLLNDTMVDFYLNHIVEHVLPDNRGSKVTVLPSIFWHNLSLRQHALDADDEKRLSDEQKLQLKFGDLHDFVSEFDLQDFDYIVIPVNEWEHWSLAVICHPFTANARTVIFDSQLTADLNNLQNMATLIESFMKYSYEKRTGNAMPFSLPCILPSRMPQQTNNFDCGIFIAEFARRFLLNPPNDLDSFDFFNEYPDFSTSTKRSEMQNAVLSLSPNRARWRPLVEILNGYHTAAPHRAL